MGATLRSKLNTILLVIIISTLNPINTSANIEFNQITDENNEIVYALEGQLHAYSQWNAGTYYTQQWLSSVSGSLYHRSSDADLKYAPMLAESDPAYSEDGLTWTIDLKSDLKFANGNPLTATDVIFTYQVALTPEIDIDSYWLYSFFFELNSSIIEIDEDTVELTFSGLNRFMQNALTLPIIEKAEYLDIYSSCLDGNKVDCDWNDPSGTFAQSAGPYKIKNFNVTEQQVTVIRNEHYYDSNNVWADQIVMKYNMTGDDVVEQFKKGEIDVVDHLFSSINGISLDDFADISNVKQLTAPAPVVQEISLNHLHPVWGTGVAIPDGNGISDNDFVQATLVRKALSHIVNRDRIANVLLNGFATPASTPVHPVVSGFNHDLVARNFSIDTAKNYLQMAGFDYSNLIDDNLDGDYGDENDTTFFNLTLLAPSWDPVRVQYVEEYAVELPKIGIGVKEVHINQTDGGFADVYGRAYGYPDGVPPLYDEGGFDILFIGFVHSAFNWDSGSRYTSDGLCDVDPSCSNYINYQNVTTEQLINSYETQLDPTEKAEILNEIQVALYNDIPVIPIIYPIDVWILAGDIEGINGILLKNTDQEWQNVKKSEWTDINPNKFVESVKSDDSLELNRNIIIGISVVAVAAVAASVFSKRK
ncbi:MAG: hypothetical protein GPJ54_12290 [Candidatus Heimdallarchaeota archaeon]|nr:hypothetical protein [Candidatus Heimdallarchaeota archaeon]